MSRLFFHNQKSITEDHNCPSYLRKVLNIPSFYVDSYTVTIVQILNNRQVYISLIDYTRTRYININWKHYYSVIKC